MLVINPSNLKIVDANPAACKYYGYKHSAMVSMDVSKINASPPDELKQNLKEALSGKQNYFILRHKLSNGTVRDVEVTTGTIRIKGENLFYSIVYDITERKQMEKLLRKSEQHYKMVSELAADYIFKLVIDANGKVTMDFVSDNFYSLTGRVKEDVLTVELWSSVIHPDDLVKVMDHLQKAIAKPQSIELECRSYIHGNKLRWINIFTRSEWNEQENRVTTIIGAVKDITERKQAEKELQQSNEKFSKVFKTSPDSITISRLSDGTYLEANQSFFDITGYTMEEVLGRSSLSGGLALWTNLEDRDRLVAGLKTYGEVIGMEAPLRMKNGTIHIALLSARIIEIDNEKCIITIARDISEHKKAEEALKNSEKRYRHLIETTDTGYVIIDNKGVVLDANPEYVRLSGHKELEDILGKNVVEWTADEVKETNALAVETCMRDGFIRNFEITYVDKNGKHTPVEINATMIETEGKQEILSLCRDITERKRAEEALNRSQERYKLLHEYAPVGILLVDRSGQILELNSATLQILGSPSPEATKTLNIITFPLLVKAGISDAFKRCVDTGQTVFGEYPYISNWGKHIMMQLRFVPILDNHAKVDMVNTIIEDITGRKQAQDALLESEARYRALIESSPDAITQTDLKGIILMCNS